MRPGVVLIVGLIAMTFTALADEKLPVLKVGGVTYRNVTITEATASDIYFRSDRGMAKPG